MPLTRFVLVDTSHAGNVGAAARAIKVMGFDDLVLVSPRRPDVAAQDEAVAMASGATDVLARARVVPMLAEALDAGDLSPTTVVELVAEAIEAREDAIHASRSVDRGDRQIIQRGNIESGLVGEFDGLDASLGAEKMSDDGDLVATSGSNIEVAAGTSREGQIG